MKPEHDSKVREIVANAWCDPEFKKRLIAQPREALAAHGIRVPEGVEIAIVENTPSKIYLVLPQKPDETLVSDEQLAGIAGGASGAVGIVPLGSRPAVDFVASLW